MLPMMANPTSPKSNTMFQILSLDSVQDANLAEQCRGRILWTSEKHPQAAVGALLDEYEGVWLEPMKIVVRINGQQIEHPVPVDLCAHAHTLFKAVLQAHLRGESPNRIQSTLATAAFTETHI